jgi:predicted acyltransferase
LRFYLYAHLFAPWAGVLAGSLLYAATYVLLWIPPMAVLYRRGIFLRV